jgi:hypothetical protein
LRAAVTTSKASKTPFGLLQIAIVDAGRQ